MADVTHESNSGITTVETAINWPALIASILALVEQFFPAKPPGGTS